MSVQLFVGALCARAHPKAPSGIDSFMLQRFHFNMNLLNLMQGMNIPLSDCSVGLDWVNAHGKRTATGLARPISEMLAGSLALRLMLPVVIKRYGECDYAFIQKTRSQGRKLESIYKLCRRGVSNIRRSF